MNSIDTVLESDDLLTLQDIANFVVSKKARCTCGCVWRRTDIRTYDHDGGYPVAGYERKQWIYFHCGACKCDQKLRNILHRIELEESK